MAEEAGHSHFHHNSHMAGTTPPNRSSSSSESGCDDICAICHAHFVEQKGRNAGQTRLLRRACWHRIATTGPRNPHSSTLAWLVVLVLALFFHGPSAHSADTMHPIVIPLLPQMPPPVFGGWMLCKKCGWRISPSLSLRSIKNSVSMKCMACFSFVFWGQAK
jgi:hypothetical protein